MMGDDKVASAARGWDDPKLKGRFLRRKNHEDDEDNEFGDDDDEISEGDFDLDEEYEDDDQSGQQRGGCDEEGFEKVLEEYEDEQLGYIEDDDEEAVEGTIDITAGESELLNAAIEEFLAVRFSRISSIILSSTASIYPILMIKIHFVFIGTKRFSVVRRFGHRKGSRKQSPNSQVSVTH